MAWLGIVAPDPDNRCCVRLESLSAEPHARLVGDASWPSGAQHMGDLFNVGHVERHENLALALLVHRDTRQRG